MICRCCKQDLEPEEYSTEAIASGDVYACGYCFTAELNRTNESDHFAVRAAIADINFRIQYCDLSPESIDELRRVLRLFDNFKLEDLLSEGIAQLNSLANLFSELSTTCPECETDFKRPNKTGLQIRTPKIKETKS